MKDIEKQVEEMEKELDDFCLDIDGECETSCSKCLANFLVNAGYRKMDEVTLKLDLGDRTPEEIKQIAKMFNGEIKKQVAKEIFTDLGDIRIHPALERLKDFEWFKLFAKKCGVELEVDND